MKEPAFKNCFCCVNLKIGCCIYVGLVFLGSIFDTFKNISELFGSDSTDNSSYVRPTEPSSGGVDPYAYGGTKYGEIGICFLTLITCILYFKGVNDRKPKFLLPFIIVQIVTLIIIAVIFLILLVYTFGLAIILLFFPIIGLIIVAYLVGCVYSYYVQLTNETMAPHANSL